jgi:hypothetical protein
MQTKAGILAGVLGVIFLGSGGFLLWQNLHRPQGAKILIVQDNTVLYTLDYPTEGTRTFRVDAPDGGWNEITIRDGSICISDADCPDHTCVKTGLLRSESLPVVCLPHKLVIRLEESE